jgi:hypothetical protein
MVLATLVLVRARKVYLLVGYWVGTVVEEGHEHVSLAVGKRHLVIILVVCVA